MFDGDSKGLDELVGLMFPGFKVDNIIISQLEDIWLTNGAINYGNIGKNFDLKDYYLYKYEGGLLPPWIIKDMKGDFCKARKNGTDCYFDISIYYPGELKEKEVIIDIPKVRRYFIKH